MSVEIQLYRGDINVQNGFVQLVSKEDKLYQQMSKLLMTDRGGYFHPEYGSGLYNLVGRYQAPDVMQPLAEDDIRNCIIYYQSIQTEQEFYQELDDDEVLMRLLSALVTPVTSTAFRVDINVMNRKANELNVTSVQGY